MNGQLMFDGSMLPDDIPSGNIVLTDPKVRANFYHTHLCECMMQVKKSLFEFCCYLSRMRSEKLYHLLGYEDFKDYTFHLNISYSLAVRYASVGKFISSEISPVKLDEDYVQDLGISKLYELTKLESDELHYLFDNYSVSDLSRKELKNSIDEVKSYKAARDSLCFTKSLSEFRAMLEENKRIEDELSSSDSQQGSDSSIVIDPVISEMIRILYDLKSASDKFEQFYQKHEKSFNGDLLLKVPLILHRLSDYTFSDILFLENYLSSGGD